MDLKTPIDKASRAYKMYAGRLEKLGILKIEDFLFHVPFRYNDYSLISKISEVQPGEIVTVQGTLEELKNVYTRRFRTFQRGVLKDDTGTIELLWFNQPFLTRVMAKGDKVSMSGKVTLDKNKLVLNSPDYEVIYNDLTIHTGRLVPIYPETKGVSSKWIRRQVSKLLEEDLDIKEYLPKDTLGSNNLMDLKSAINTIHFPKNLDEAQKAKERLSFDELFEIQLSALIRKKEWDKEKIKKPFKIDREKINDFIKNLPFKLTNSQQKAIEDIISDLSSEKPMNRLLEGDVGSGKTVVGAVSVFLSYLNGFQSAFMAPTEILANQHFKTLTNLLNPFGVKVELATGNSRVKDNKFDLVIGTHALVHKKVTFKKLGLVVIDEQQRFGVEQRSIIRKKGDNPHLLTMTATPIPRTVALTMYGDLDLSLLNEMPVGRKLVKTWLVPKSKRDGAYKWIEDKILKEKDQVFIVCPFIEESESMTTVKAATKEYERLKNDIFPKLKLGLLHGKMKANEKAEILRKFKEGKIDILVSTPVVEVGIDIPNATIMLIEESERFGLAQLHQLRGRVGRSDKQSFCLLFTSSLNPLTIKRLKGMETIYSGAELAELDLKLRGPGQIYGTSQHGIPKLKVASFSDFELIDKTKREAEKIIQKIDKYPDILKKIENSSPKSISPD
jgi:ATP-dependent DNA helicase RecG